MVSKDGTLAAEIFAAARKFPNHKACIYGRRYITYHDLSQLALQASHIIASKGVNKGDIVFVCLNNCIEVPVIYLALMSLGAIFVPINPLWPEKKLSDLIKHTQPSAIISADQLPDGNLHARCHIKLAHIFCSIRNNKNEREVTQVSLDDPIYAFFTSGSTGVPKCTVNAYRGIKNRFNFMSQLFSHLKDTNVVLQNSKLSFDSSIWQLLWPLTTGATVVIRQSTQLTDFDRILDEIATNKVTMTDFVPTVFSEFVDYVKRHPQRIKKVQSLRALLIGGEAIRANDVWTLKDLVPNMEAYNTYGPTEASIGMMFRKVTEEDREYIPIGTPIPNTYAVIVDDQGNKLPDGERGEILIGGVCVGLGYLNDQEKTEQSYINNTFADIPSEKLFRTGNIGYRDHRGIYHCCGRSDDEVKIGGVRLALNEIESEINRLPDIKSVKAMVYRLHKMDHLACFVETAKNISEADIKEQLRTRIANECIPKRIIVLTSFPMNDNGKLDLQGLKVFLPSESNASACGFKDENNFVTRIRRLVENVLGIAVKHAGDNLFELGANSLDIYILCRKLEEETGVNVVPSDLFDDFCLNAILNLLKGSVERSDNEITDGSALLELLRSDAQLDIPKLRTSNLHWPKPKNNVLLTGGGGYIGIHLLDRLARSTQIGKIYCLVRKTEDACYAALLNTAQYYGLALASEAESKLKFIVGDVTSHQFGLSELEFKKLANDVSKIYPLAAKVNLVADYKSLRGVNVMALKETLRLAAINTSEVVYVSSNSINEILNEHTHDTVMTDPHVQKTISGYNLSKIVCEKILMEYTLQIGKVTILRVGDVVPAHAGCRQNKMSIIAHLASLFSRTKAIPNLSIPMDTLSISQLCDALMCCQEGLLCLSEDVSFQDFFKLYCKNCQIVDVDVFYQALESTQQLDKGAEYVRSILLGYAANQMEEAILENFIMPYVEPECLSASIDYHFPELVGAT